MTQQEMVQELLWDFWKRALADEERCYQKGRRFLQLSEKVLEARWAKPSSWLGVERNAMGRSIRNA